MSDCAGVQPLLTNEDLSDEGKLEEEKLTDKDNSNLIQEDAYFSEESDNTITIGFNTRCLLDPRTISCHCHRQQRVMMTLQLCRRPCEREIKASHLLQKFLF